jgi:PIN domain nuclease of toxin-antitoxin system
LHFAVHGGELELTIPFEEWLDRLFVAPGFSAQPLDMGTIKVIHWLNFHNDPFDIAIVATAMQMDLPLITNDSIIHKKKPCKLYWD